MAVMTDNQRAAVWREIMERLSAAREPLGAMTKQELRDAVNNTDTWVSSNAASYNTSLPTAFKNNATAGQKTQLLQLVLKGRMAAGV